jgi:hypothetical protein
MKVNLLAYVLTGAIAVAAGVAIAGLPTSSADTIVVDPSSVTAAPTTAPDETSTDVATTTTVLAATTTATATTTSVIPAAEPTSDDSSTEPIGSSQTSEVADVTSTTATTTATTPPPTTPPPTTTAPELPMRERSDLTVAVVNAANEVGVAGDWVERLTPLGYTQIRRGDAFAAPTSAVYAAAGLEREGARLAGDAGLPDAPVRPLILAPDMTAGGEFELILVLGIDLPQ